MSLSDHTAFPPIENEMRIAILEGFLAEAMNRAHDFVAHMGPFDVRAASFLVDDTNEIPTTATGWKDFWERQAEKRFKQ